MTFSGWWLPSRWDSSPKQTAEWKQGRWNEFHPSSKQNFTLFSYFMLFPRRHAHTVTFPSRKDRLRCPTPLVPSFLWDAPPPPRQPRFPSSPFRPVTRRGVKRPDYLHWPRSVSPGRRSRSHWFPLTRCEGEEGGGDTGGAGKQTLAPASRPSSAGWWMSRTSRSLPPKPMESGYNELQSLGRPPQKTFFFFFPSRATHERHSPPQNPSLTQVLPPLHKQLEVYPGLLTAATTTAAAATATANPPALALSTPSAWLRRFLPAGCTLTGPTASWHMLLFFVTPLHPSQVDAFMRPNTWLHGHAHLKQRHRQPAVKIKK